MQPIIFAKGGYPKVQNLLVLTFADTRATSGSDPGSGFTDLRILRPGFTPPAAGQQQQLFTDNWAALLGIFDRHRWMGATGTNSFDWSCGPPNAGACSMVEWSSRPNPERAFEPRNAVPWEHGES